MDNYKIAFIHGEEEPERGFKEGELQYYGEIKEDLLHTRYLLNFVNEYYQDTPIFKHLNIRHQRELIAYFLIEKGCIVFFNTTPQDETSYKRYGKTGQLMLPNNITDKQKQVLLAFSKTIPDYEILISYNITLENGFLDSGSYQAGKGIEPYEILSNFLETKEKSKIKKK